MILLRVPILGDIIDFIALLMGYIMQALFFITGGFNIGLCIILFTIIVRLIMMPMTIKQQRFSKLSAMMQPEIAAIQNKYKGKTILRPYRKCSLRRRLSTRSMVHLLQADAFRCLYSFLFSTEFSR